MERTNVNNLNGVPNFGHGFPEEALSDNVDAHESESEFDEGNADAEDDGGAESEDDAESSE